FTIPDARGLARKNGRPLAANRRCPPPGSVSGKDRVMQLGFVSAILPELSLEEVLTFARDEHFACVELMCWPPGGADRRYAGVTHLDVTALDDGAVCRTGELIRRSGVTVSGLGY